MLKILIEDNATHLQEHGLVGGIAKVEYVDRLKTPDQEVHDRIYQIMFEKEHDYRIGVFSIKPSIFYFEEEVRTHLAVRETLVRTRSRYISLIGALARREGCRVKSGVSRSFAIRVEEAGLPQHILIQIEPLLIMLKALNEQIKLADEKLAEIVKDDEVVRRLTSVPGVGPVTATTYAAIPDGAERFQDARQVRSYLGLVPREHSSGEKQHRGRISKAGNSRARALLVEAAWALLRCKTSKTQALHEWAKRIASRRGKATAVVALARKIAGIMFAMWRDGTEFNPDHSSGNAVTAAT